MLVKSGYHVIVTDGNDLVLDVFHADWGKGREIIDWLDIQGLNDPDNTVTITFAD